MLQQRTKKIVFNTHASAAQLWLYAEVIRSHTGSVSLSFGSMQEQPESRLRIGMLAEN